MDLDIERDPTDQQVDDLRQSLIAYNVAQHGFRDVAKTGVFVKNDAGELEAGVYAETWGGVCQVELLWVADARRGEGLGTRLIEAIEGEARRMGCSKIVLDTFSYQAPDFYRKLGFEQMGETPDFPEGHSYYLFAKPLI